MFLPLAAAAPPFLVEVAVLIVCGALIAYIGYRLGLVPIVGFLLTGVIIGPNALGFIQDPELVDATAEIGVILLLFTIGIEFSLEKLGRIKRLIFGGGGLQVALTTALTAGVLVIFGVPLAAGIFTGFLVALSSTAIVLKLLANRGETNTEPGQVGLGILIFQDLAIIVMVMLVPVLAGEGGSALEIGMALGTAALMIGAVLIIARRLLPPLLERVARTCSQELFLLTLIALCFGTAYLASLAGVSVALGAFLAGLIVSESRFSEHAFGEIMPLQILFAATFFVSVGMLLNLEFLISNLPLVLGVVLVVLIIKVVTTAFSARVLGYSTATAAASALLLAQVGEFSFVLERAGREVNLFPAGTAEVGSQAFIAATVILMILTPPLSQLGMKLGRRMQADEEGTLETEPVMESETEAASSPEGHFDLENHVVIAGYGRSSRRLTQVLQQAKIPHVILTLSPPRAREAEEAGLKVVRGDATRQNALQNAGLLRAKTLFIPDDDPEFAHRVASVARTLNPTVRIVTRTRYESDAHELFEGGIDQVVTEEFETIAQLFAELLRDHQLSHEEVEHCMTVVRGEHYLPLRKIPEDDLLAPIGDLIAGAFDLRTVTIREGAEVVGQSLGDLVLEQAGLKIKKLERGRSVVTMPPDHLTLQVGDMLTLGGTAQAFVDAADLFRSMQIEAPSGDGHREAVDRTEEEVRAHIPSTSRQVHVYGTDWCPLTGGFRAYLKRQEIKFDYHNIEEDAEAEETVKAMNGGKIKFPMVVVGEQVMKNPAIDELNAALRDVGLIAVEG